MTYAYFKPDHIGVGRMLRAPFMQAAMVSRAEIIKARAIAIAPVSDDPNDPTRGSYKASFHIRSHSHGGATKDRAEAIVYNDDPAAIYVEFGRRHRNPHHTLANAAFQRMS
jgi:hypothetical protein